MSIPAEHLDRARPLIENEIARLSESANEERIGEQEKHQADTLGSKARAKEVQTNTAIETFHRAETGDPKARALLLDQTRELLGEEPRDDDLFDTILENETGNPLAQDTVLEVALSDEKAEAYQKVLDVFDEFRVIWPQQTKSSGPSFRLNFSRSWRKAREA